MTQFGWTNKEEIFLLTSVGNQKTQFSKRDYTPVEVGEKIQKAIKNGASVNDIASFLSVDKSLISRFLRVYKDLDKKYHHLISFRPVPEGKIAFDTAQEIARFSKKDQSKLISAILEYNFKREQIQGVFQQLKRTDKKLEEIIETLSKRSGGKRRFMVMGLIPEDVKHILQSYTQDKLDILSKKILNSKNLNKSSQSKEILIQELTVGKETFSLIIRKGSLPRDMIEFLSDLIQIELKNELK
jgi:hypothetical protein